jgi:hypothetical protein
MPVKCQTNEYCAAGEMSSTVVGAAAGVMMIPNTWTSPTRMPCLMNNCLLAPSISVHWCPCTRREPAKKRARTFFSETQPAAKHRTREMHNMYKCVCIGQPVSLLCGATRDVKLFVVEHFDQLLQCRGIKPIARAFGSTPIGGVFCGSCAAATHRIHRQQHLNKPAAPPTCVMHEANTA